MRRPPLRLAVLALLASGAACSAWAGESSSAADLTQKSLPLRTALHHDPTLAAPFERLVGLYREADRMDELVDLYRSHLATYPNDVHALTVFVRLLAATGDAEALGVARSAVNRHPDNPFLHYVLYEVLRAGHDETALFALDRAIDRESRPGRKRAWSEEFLPLAIANDRRDLARKHLEALASDVARAPQAAVEAARKMNRYGFHELALDTLDAAAAASPPPEVRVEIELAAAAAEAAVGSRKAAAQRLDRLLGQVTVDYWRRPEILRRRVELVASEEERKALLAQARQRVDARPRDEAAALQLAQLLEGFEHRRQALEVLLAASRRIPRATRIEEQTLALLDRLRDERGREGYLAERLAALPNRHDLRLQHARSLFLLGRREEATRELDQVLAAVDPGERAALLLETARYLRRASQPADAASLFERALALSPERLDVLRELAETYLVVGEKERARRLFAEGLPEGATQESLLDLVPFLIEHQMYREAEAALRARLHDAPANLPLRLLLLRVLGRQGHQASGEELVLDIRQRTDTPARYRRWLEAAVAFHDRMGTLDDFLDQEQARLALERGKWTSARLERRLAFADVAVRNGRKAEVAQMIRNDLDEDPPREVRIRLRRRLLHVLSEQEVHAQALEQELKKLIEEDPQAADEYNARLALLYAEGEQAHLAGPLLDKVRIAKLDDTALLEGVRKLCEASHRTEKVLEVLARLTDLEPSNRSHWERWLTALAATGDEARLRSAARRLLAGVRRMPLSKETRELLEDQLADSYWRSIARRMAEGDEPALRDARVLVDSVGRMVEDREEWLWVAWARAYVLNRLGREEARDEAIAELERVVAEAPGAAEEEQKKPPEPQGGEQEAPAPVIAFPDGLAVSLAAAKKLLTSKPVEPRGPPAADRRGPLPKFRVQWVFESDYGAAVSKILPLSQGRVLVSDLGGALYCLDLRTGKLLWERSGGGRGSARGPGQMASASASVSVYRGSGPYYPSAYVRSRYGRARQPAATGMRPAVPVADGRGRVVMPSAAGLSCYAAGEGKLLWRAAVGGAPVASGGEESPPPVSAFAHEDTVVAWRPEACAAACFEASSGKLVWERQLACESGAGAEWHRSGASVDGGRLLVYGPCAAVLDARTGEVVWSFEPSRVRRFPVRLGGPGATSGQAGAVSAATSPALRYRGYPRCRVPGWRSRRQVLDYFQSRAGPLRLGEIAASQAALAAPAVAWADVGEGAARLGVMFGERLLLLGPQGLHVLRLDLPLAARRMPASGTFVGMAGEVACLLQEGGLLFADLGSGETRPYSLEALADGRNHPRIQAAVDGILVYVTGPGGVLCVNARANQRVFQAKWPAGVKVPPPPGEPQPRQYLWQGVSSYLGEGYGPCLPLTDCVADGVLLATLTPRHVVALVERGADGR
ncbi:MAG: PQQ-binding-like beta-propeller repeat protein [Candidatus Brocadiia bacterium]